MSQVLSFTLKATKLTRWPVLIVCCKLLQRIVAQCQIKICYCPSPFCTSIVIQAFVNHLCVLAGHWNQTLWFRVIHQSLISNRNRSNHHSSLCVSSLCSVICNDLTLKPCLVGTMTTIKFTRAVQHLLCTQPWICPLHMLLLWRTVWSQQWPGVRCQPFRCRRAWHETCSSVCKPWQASSGRIGAKEQNGRSSESRRSFHSFYSDASYGWQWREPCRQCRSCRLHRGPSLEGLRTGLPGPWLPIPMRKWSPDRERSPPALHYAEQDLLSFAYHCLPAHTWLPWLQTESWGCCEGH